MSSVTKLVAAAAAVAVFVGLSSTGIPSVRSEPVASPSHASASHDADQPAIHWQTDRVDLRADGLTLQVGDQTFTPEGADVSISEDVRSMRNWRWLARWTQDESAHALALDFTARGTHWHVESAIWRTSGITVSQGGRGYGTFSFGAANATRTRLGDAVLGDVQRSTDGLIVPCEASEGNVRLASRGRGVLTIDGLRLSVTLRERSLVDKVLRALGLDGLLDEHFDPMDMACPPGTGSLEGPEKVIPRPSHTPLGGAAVVEQVRPHVVRVRDDGACHDLTDIDTFEDPKPVSLIAVGEEGSVWLTSSDGFIRIGTPGEIPDPLDTFLAQMEIGPDGTLWIADGHHGSSIGRFRSGSWTIQELPSTSWIVWLEATSEGGLALAWRDRSTLKFGELSGTDGDQLVASSPPPLELGSPDGDIVVANTPDGRTWVAESLWWQEEQRREPGRLWVFDGVSWRRSEPLGADVEAWPNEMVVDGAGRLWITWLRLKPGAAGFGSSGYLTRLDDERSWTVFDDPEQVATGGWLLADGGSVWLTPGGWCDGYARFDGEQLGARYVEGLCIRRPGISPTGDIWLFGHGRGREEAGVYVITP